MLGTKFTLDEEKILREGEYNLDSIYEVIEEIATKRAKLTKVSKNHYVTEHKNGVAHLGILVFNYLAEYDWFTVNVREWLWLSDKEGKSDIIALLKKYNDGVWA